MVEQKRQTELDLFGEILTNCVEFARQDFSVGLVLHDGVQDEHLQAGRMFQPDEESRRWAMSQDSLPGDLAIKAVAVNKQRILLEIAPVDLERAREVLLDRGVPASIHPAQICNAFGTPVARRMSEHIGNAAQGISPRQLWAIPWTRPQLCAIAIQVFDAIYTASACSIEGMEDAEGGGSVATQQSMQMRMSIQLQLQQEQRPVLLLEGRTDLLTVQRQELRGIMGLQHRVLRMTPDELETWAANEAAKPGGARKVYDAIVFAMAGRIRAVRPSFNWREARQHARRLIAQSQ